MTNILVITKKNNFKLKYKSNFYVELLDLPTVPLSIKKKKLFFVLKVSNTFSTRYT